MPPALMILLPNWAYAFLAWTVRPAVLATLIGASIALFVMSLIGLPFFLTRLPADFFSRPERRRLRLAEHRRPFVFVLVRGLKNLLGAVLLIVGVLMVFTPGPGLLTIFAALFLVDFPGKHRLQRWIISRPAVHRPINALRKRARRLPLNLPEAVPGARSPASS